MRKKKESYVRTKPPRIQLQRLLGLMLLDQSFRWTRCFGMDVGVGVGGHVIFCSF